VFDYTSALTQVFGYGADKTLDNTTDEAIRKSYYDNIIITISNKEKPHFLESSSISQHQDILKAV
jgi:hypothetical protein